MKTGLWFALKCTVVLAAVFAPPVSLLRSLYAEIIRLMNADVSPTRRLHECAE